MEAQKFIQYEGFLYSEEETQNRVKEFQAFMEKRKPGFMGR